MTYRRLPLERLSNARELGGYPIPGGATQYGRFIRSELPARLTTADLDFLREYGVTDSIDFRGDDEVLEHPSIFERVDWVSYHRCPTFDKQVAFASAPNSDDARPPFADFLDWGEKYIELAQTGRAWVRDTLGVMARAEGAVMFNCTTGKDRTGVISALLLGLAGVSEPDIASDYCVSEVYLAEKYRELLGEFLARWPDADVTVSSPFFKTAPESIRALLTHINKNCGGIEEYIKSCGVSGGEIAALRAKLCGGIIPAE